MWLGERKKGGRKKAKCERKRNKADQEQKREFRKLNI
jgi:hypothetical protein